MKSTTLLMSTLASGLLPAVVLAQTPTEPAEKWAIGLGAAAIESPYAGEDTRIRPFPLVSYEGERLFLRGISGGVHLYDSGPFLLDAVFSARLDGFDIEDLGRNELLANGVDPGLLSDRDDQLDAGLRATFRSALGSVAIEGLQDVTGTSEGYEIKLDYRYRWQLPGTTLTASAGGSWLSADLAGYYYGTLDEEVARGVAAYDPGSAFVPRIGFSAMHTLGNSKWQLLGGVDYQRLPDELTDSPLVDRDADGMARVMIGVSRRF